jgi:DNA-binding transcriptional ArsR family regulator
MSEPTDGRYAYGGLDRVLHEKARLGILTALVTHRDGLSFNDLARLCTLTDGNLSRHLDVLAEDDLVLITKAFAGRRPLTTCKLTATGRKRFREYLEQLERVLRDAAEDVVPARAGLRQRAAET